MKNDKLLIAFNQREMMPITFLKEQIQKQKLNPLDSGQLINIKGGGTDTDPVKTN